MKPPVPQAGSDSLARAKAHAQFTSQSNATSMGKHNSQQQARSRSLSRGLSTSSTDFSSNSSGTSSSDFTNSNSGIGTHMVPQIVNGIVTFVDAPNNHNQGEGSGTSIGNTQAASAGRALGNARSQGESDGVSQGSASGVSSASAIANVDGRTQMTSITEARSKGGSRSVGHSNQTTVGFSTAATEQKSSSDGGSVTNSETVSTSSQETHLAQFRLVDVDSGQLVRNIDDQLAAKTKMVRCFGVAECLISLDEFDSSIPIRVDDVPDAFDGLSDDWREYSLKQIKDEIASSKPCYLPPFKSLANPTVEAEELDKWIRDASLAAVDDDSDEANHKNDAIPYFGICDEEFPYDF